MPLLYTKQDSVSRCRTGQTHTKLERLTADPDMYITCFPCISFLFLFFFSSIRVSRRDLGTKKRTGLTSSDGEITFRSPLAIVFDYQISWISYPIWVFRGTDKRHSSILGQQRVYDSVFKSDFAIANHKGFKKFLTRLFCVLYLVGSSAASAVAAPALRSVYTCSKVLR